MFVSPRFHTNEADLVSGLVARGLEVSYFVHEAHSAEDHSSVVPVILGYRGRAGEWPAEKRLRSGLYPRGTSRRILEEDPAVVILKGFRLAVLLLAVQLRIRRVPYVIHVQKEILHEDSTPRQRLYWRLFGRRVITPVRLDRASRRSPSRVSWWGQEWRYVPFVRFPRAAAQDRAYFAGGAVNVLIVGKFVARKRILDALDALDHLRSAGHQLEVVVAGTVLDPLYLAKVRDFARDREWISVLCDVAVDEMESLYLNGDVFVLPSVGEPASYSQLEAMSYGMAAFVCDDNGTADYVREGETGHLLSKVDFAQGLERVLGDLLLDRPAISRLGMAGFERVKSEHGLEPFLRAIATLGVVTGL